MHIIEILEIKKSIFAYMHQDTTFININILTVFVLGFVTSLYHGFCVNTQKQSFQVCQCLFFMQYWACKNTWSIYSISSLDDNIGYSQIHCPDMFFSFWTSCED
jgi:hypothetical protein